MAGAVEAIRALSVLDVALRLGIEFRRRGWACCTFHGERSPSLHVTAEFYHCFGCGVSGDAIKLVQAHQRLDFKSALGWFAREFGVTDDGYVRPLVRPRAERPQEKRWRAERSAEPYVMDWGVYAPYATEFTRYVVDRGLLASTCRLRRLGHDGEALRALWPIVDRDGRLRGVSGRLYADGCLRCGEPLKPHKECPACGYQQPPKWLHSDGFDRADVLYGEDQIEPEVRTCILVEGLMDRDMLWQWGWRNVLATAGTAFEVEHARKVVSWFDRVVLFTDGDAAGRKMAAEWLAEIGPQLGVGQVRVVSTPDGADPGSLPPSESSSLLIHCM